MLSDFSIKKQYDKARKFIMRKSSFRKPNIDQHYFYHKDIYGEPKLVSLQY
jgi:hypothetical protein